MHPRCCARTFAILKIWAEYFPAGTRKKSNTIPRHGFMRALPQRNAGPFAGHSKHGGGHGKDRGGEAGDLGEHKNDPSLENPRCVFQVLKKHFARYTPETG